MEVFDRKTKIIGVCVYFLLVFVTERFYKEALFNYSLNKIPEFQQTYSFTIKFFDIFTNLGKFEGIFPLIILLFNFIPISVSYFLLIFYSISFYLDSILKYLYQDPRPYFVNTNIIPFKGDSDYGNPSGHSLASTVFYIGLLNFCKNTTIFKNNKNLFYLFSIFVSFTLILIIFSRFILGVHAINQLLLGFLIGLGLYFIFFHIIDIHSYSNGTRFFLLNMSESYNILSFSVYFGLVILSIICYSFLDFDHTYLPYVENTFGSDVPFELFENYEFTMSLLIFTVIGSHSGILYLLYFIKKYYKVDKINYDNLNNFESSISEINKFLRCCLIFLMIFISTLPYFLVNDTNTLPVIFLLKFTFPSFLFGFVLFGIVPLVCLKLDFFPESLLEEISKNVDQPDYIVLNKDVSNLNII
jgi:membrane-associated phospholipid phosphatase